MIIFYEASPIGKKRSIDETYENIMPYTSDEKVSMNFTKSSY